MYKTAIDGNLYILNTTRNTTLIQEAFQSLRSIRCKLLEHSSPQYMSLLHTIDAVIAPPTDPSSNVISLLDNADFTFASILLSVLYGYIYILWLVE